MNQQDNILFAKSMLADTLWKAIRLEGYNTSFPETKCVLDNAIIQKMDMHEVNFLLHLKRAWKWMLSTLNEDLTLDYLCKLHYEVAYEEAIDYGKLRTGTVYISGTNYVPPIPTELGVQEKLEWLEAIPSPENRALEAFLYFTKAQLFFDGNKRIASLITNKILIQHGLGLFSVPPDQLQEFQQLLHDWYETGSRSLVNFIRSSIRTIEKNPQREEVER